MAKIKSHSERAKIRRRRRAALLRRIDANRARMAKKFGVMDGSVASMRAERERQRECRRSS